MYHKITPYNTMFEKCESKINIKCLYVQSEDKFKMINYLNYVHKDGFYF